MEANYNKVNAEKIISFFKSKGFNGYMISGILSNFTFESALEPSNAQNNINRLGVSDADYTYQVDNGTYYHPTTHKNFCEDGVGYGLAQWTSAGRKTGLYNYCKSCNVSISNLYAQLEFCLQEFCSGYIKVLNSMKSRTNAYDCAVDMVVGYEKPASVLNPKTAEATKIKRGELAEEFYKEYFKGESKPMKDKVLAISAGHYLYTTGKRIPKALDPTETREWVLNARVADMLTGILNRYEGVKILRVDDPTGEKGIAIENRVANANKQKVDFYLAIHHNAGAKLTTSGGVVVYHYPTAVDKTNAKNMYDSVIAHNGLKGNRSQPLSTNYLYEVYKTNAPALLIENGFMDSTIDEPQIITKEFAQRSAEGMAEFFVKYWGLQLKKEESKSDILAEIESVKANINALEKRLAELEAML